MTVAIMEALRSRVLAIAGLIGLALSLQGCVAVAVGGVAATARTVAQDRTVGDAMDDVGTKVGIQRRMLSESGQLFLKTDVAVVEGRVLLTGIVPDQDARIAATRIAWQAPGVKEVINELEISDKRGIVTVPHDALIATRLRARLIGDKEIKSVNYSIEAKDRVIYLMGIARSNEELDRVVDQARSVKGARNVVSYVKVKSDPTRSTTRYSSLEPGYAAPSEPTGAINASASRPNVAPTPEPDPAPRNVSSATPPGMDAPQGYVDLSDKYDKPATRGPTELRPLPPITTAPLDVKPLSAPPAR